MLEAVNAIRGIGDANADITAELLYQHGFKSADEIVAGGYDGLAEVDGLAPERATEILEAASERSEELADAAKADAAKAEAPKEDPLDAGLQVGEDVQGSEGSA